MTKFIDGPASHVVLELQRSPLFLRVVHDTTYATAVCKKARREWDALDLLTDTPRLGEKVYVYVKVSDDGTVHVDGRDAKTGKRFGRWLSMATYKLFDPQPPDATTRNTKLWQEWAHVQAAKMGEKA
jgi:hypothetical protein